MIIVELNGGLGNQLFQYAAGLSLSLHHNVPLKVNPLSFSKPDPITGTKRQLELNNFEGSPVIASEKEIESLLQQPSAIRLLEKGLPFHKRKVYKEKGMSFDPNFFKSRKETYLKGNRQSEKYFKAFDNEIRQLLTVNKTVVSNAVISYAELLHGQHSISIHIRRGDYLTQIALDVLGILPVEYYQRAISYFTEKINTPVFHIFTDDTEWVKTNLKLECDYSIVSDTISKTAMEDFYLMQNCKHNIIANSTFSWWSAWLNNSPDKTVIAPLKWYNSPSFDNKDLIPTNWIRL